MTNTLVTQTNPVDKFIEWRKAKEDQKNDWSILGWSMASALIFTLMCATNPVVFGVTLLLIAISFSIAQLVISYSHFNKTKAILHTNNNTTDKDGNTNKNKHTKMSYFEHLKITKQHDPADIYRGYTRSAIIAMVASLGIIFLAPAPIAILALFISAGILAFCRFKGFVLENEKSEKDKATKDQFKALYNKENTNANNNITQDTSIHTANKTQHFNNKHFAHLDKPYDIWLKNKKSLKNNWNIIRYSSAISIICILITGEPFITLAFITLGTALIAFAIIFGLAQLLTSLANFYFLKKDYRNSDDKNTQTNIKKLTYWEHLKQKETFSPHEIANGKSQILFLTAAALLGISFLAASPPALIIISLMGCMAALATIMFYYFPQGINQSLHTEKKNEANNKLHFLSITQNLNTAKAPHKGSANAHGNPAIPGGTPVTEQPEIDSVETNISPRKGLFGLVAGSEDHVKRMGKARATHHDLKNG